MSHYSYFRCVQRQHQTESSGIQAPNWYSAPIKSKLGCLLVLLCGLLASIPVTNAARESMTVEADGIMFEVQRYDDDRTLKYRLLFQKDGISSKYKFYATSGSVRLIETGSEAYKVIYLANGNIESVSLTPSRRSRVLAGAEQALVENFDNEAPIQEHRRLYACEDCEEAWDTVCGQGLASMCALQDYGAPFLENTLLTSVDDACISFSVACASFSSSSDACAGQCDAPAPAPTPTPAPAPIQSPVPAPAPVTPTPVTTMPVSAPTTVKVIPNTCDSELPTIRWEETTAQNRLYMEGEGCATMTDLYNARSDNTGPMGPVYILDENNDIVTIGNATPTGKWLLTSEFHIRENAIFYCRGTDLAGGDCDELRIQSTGPDDFYEVRGHGGSLYFENTVVTSWDTPNKSVQETYEDGRSFLNCVSEKETEVECEGEPKNDYGECRMDIINSEMGHMGWFDGESYGLTWKVRGFCKDKSNPEVFDNTNVYGDIKNSDIHHMYYGMYSYGHQGGVWTNNKMHDNFQYGFDPHDDSDYITIANNEVYNNVNHGIIASKRCNSLEVYNNEVYNGGAEAAGIFMHRSSDSAKIYDNNVHDMSDAGMAILESFDAEIYDNTFTNVKYGIRISLGGANNYVHDNTFDTCSKYGLYTYMGSDDPEQSDDGRPGENVFENNQILNTAEGVKINEGDNTVIIGNEFTGVTELRFEAAIGTTWSGNTVSPDSACSESASSSTFTTSSSGLPVSC